jgi:hypothetical protein
MKKSILILLAIFHSLSISSQTEVTFTVNTANITVGDNGMYLGGGIFNSAIAHEMSDDDADGTYGSNCFFRSRNELVTILS